MTLFIFPLPTFLVLGYMENLGALDILQPEAFHWKPIGIGLLFGGVYAFIALLMLKSKVFDSMPNRIERIVREMKLNLFDAIFISICAGVGEELLFRSGVQFYLGPIYTSVIFVAIHGYLNPFDWKMSIYGLIILPFILLLSYGLEPLGIWFCIAAHFCYDFVLFITMSKPTNEPQSSSELFVEPINTEEEQ